LAALTVLKPDYSKGNFQLLETIALTNTSTATVNKGVSVPEWAVGCTFVVDITITGTTPLFDFNIKGVNIAAPSSSSIPVNTSDAFLIGGAAWIGITQLTTDTSTPMVTIHLGPHVTTDVTGSATVDSVYAVNCYLPPMLMYTYVVDGTTGDEDYNGSISVYWDRRSD
jgi:hypothetical protein